MAFDRANLPTDTGALHRIILAQAAEAEAREAELAAAKVGLMAKALEIEKYKLQIARLQRMQFGRSSEKIARTIEQFELRLEELATETPAASSEASAAPDEPSPPIERPRHRAARSPNAGHCPRIFRHATWCTRQTAPARFAAARCARLGGTSPAFSVTSRVISKRSGMSARRSRAGAVRAWCKGRCRASSGEQRLDLAQLLAQLRLSAHWTVRLQT